MSPGDLKIFQNRYKLPAQSIDHLVPPTLKREAQVEASLDVQYITALGQNVPTWWVYLDGHASNPFGNEYFINRFEKMLFRIVIM